MTGARERHLCWRKSCSRSNKPFICFPLLHIGVKRDRRMAAHIARFEDRTVIEMTVAGRTDCFSVLMNRHRAAVTRCIGAIVKNRSDVEDLVQETFLKAWLRLSTFRFEANFRTWITRVAVNEALASYRRQRHRPFCSALANLETLPSSWGSPDKTLARLEARRTVRSAIAGLPNKYREILTLCDLKQLSAKETARELKSSIPLVKTRLFRARHMLSTALNRDAA